MGDLYSVKRYEDLVEGEYILAYGHHVVMWDFELFGQPSYAFVPISVDVEELTKQRDELAAVCEELVTAMVRYQMDVGEDPPYQHRKMMRRANVAIANVRSKP